MPLPSSLLPLAGAALRTVAGSALESLAEGLSFADVLRHPRETPPHSAPPSDPAGFDPAALPPPGPLSAARLAAFRRRPHQELARFSQQLEQQLQAAGVDLSRPVRLKIGGRGAVLVDDNHPQRATIEQLFAGDDQLTASFHALATMLGSHHSPDDFRLVIDGRQFHVEFA